MTTTTNEVTEIITGIQERRIARELEERQDRQLLEALYSDAMATADAAAAAFYALTGEHISLTSEPVEAPDVGPVPEDAPADPFVEDLGPDPFSDDYYGSSAADDDAPEDSEEAERERYEASILSAMDRNERSTLYAAIQEAGGIETRDDLREEYRQIPNSYKRRDGLAGDEMADHLATYYPQYGIETENDLLEYFTDRTAADRNRRVR